MLQSHNFLSANLDWLHSNFHPPDCEGKVNCNVLNTRGVFGSYRDESLGSDSQLLIVGFSSTISLKNKRFKNIGLMLL